MFGTQGVLVSWFTSAGGQTASLVALRFITGGLVFACVAVVTRLALPSGRQAAGAVLTGLGHVVFTTCLLRGFATSSVALTVLLFYTYPLLVTVAAAALYGEELSPRRIGVVAVGMVGVALAVGDTSGGTASGVLYGLGASAGCACVVLGNRALLRGGMTVPALAATAYAIPCVVLLGLTAVGVIPLPPRSASAWAPACAYLGLTVAAFWIFYTAVSRIGASLASLLAILEPLTSVLLAWWLLDEPLQPVQIVGGALILAAVASLSLDARGGDNVAAAAS
jgi:drug/metabolite transporter (DMT)-like permease